MIISSQGFGHFVKGINNQDFGIESSRAILILDGCSGALMQKLEQNVRTNIKNKGGMG